jgi:hypothetical protein
VGERALDRLLPGQRGSAAALSAYVANGDDRGVVAVPDGLAPSTWGRFA